MVLKHTFDAVMVGLACMSVQATSSSAISYSRMSESRCGVVSESAGAAMSYALTWPIAMLALFFFCWLASARYESRALAFAKISA